MYITYFWSPTTHGMSLAFNCLQLSCYLLLAPCHLRLATCYFLLSTFYFLVTTCHLPLATCHLPLATCHLSLATCHLPLATCQNCHLLLVLTTCTYYCLVLLTAGSQPTPCTGSSHTSVLGMRVPAGASGATCCCIAKDVLLHSLHSGRVRNSVDEARLAALAGSGNRGGGGGCGTHRSGVGAGGGQLEGAHHLAVLPVECNLTGDRLPVQEIADALNCKRQAAGAANARDTG